METPLKAAMLQTPCLHDALRPDVLYPKKDRHLPKQLHEDPREPDGDRRELDDDNTVDLAY